MLGKRFYLDVIVWLVLTGHFAIALDVVIRPVEDINPNGDSEPYGFVEFQGQLYFGASGPSGKELYRTDGTQVELVADISPNGDSSPTDFIVLGDHLYFATQDASNGAVYRTDGVGVELVTNVGPLVNSLTPALTEYDGWLYFSGVDGGDGSREVYRTNGNETERIAVDAGIPSNPSWFAVFNDELYFAATGRAGIELYKTDGTNVALAADVNPNGNSFPGWLTPYQDRLIFWATVNDGNEPYELNGTQVRQLADLNPGPADSSPNRFTEFEGNLYFGAHDGSSPEVHRYDGQRVTQVQDLNPREESENEGFPWSFDIIDDKLYIPAFGENGLDLYSLNKSADGSESLVLEADTNPVSHSLPIQLTKFGDDIFFSAWDEEGFVTGESELYQLNDGDARLANHLGLGEDVVNPAHLTVFSGELFFGGSGPEGNELYKATLAGDANSDGRVNFTDFLTFASMFQTANPTWASGDFNLDGEVEFADFLLLSANFGQRATSRLELNDVAVPEPNALRWLAFGGFFSLSSLLRNSRRPRVS